MDKKQIEELKKRLEEQKNSIEKELEGFASKDPDVKNNWDAKYPNREDGDKEEEADEVQEYNNALSLEHNLELKLRDIEIALEKIKNGRYGLCEKCGKQIDSERLEAEPSARLCMKCNAK